MLSVRAPALAVSLLVVSGCGGSGGSGARGDAALAQSAANSALLTQDYRISVGDVEQQSAVICIRSPVAQKLRLSISTSPTFMPPTRHKEVAVASAGLPVKFTEGGLQPATRYYVLASNDAGAWTAEFRTPGAAGARRGLHFGVAGDWRQDMAPYPSVRNASELELDFFVELGDTIYADVASPDVPTSPATTLEEFRAKHAEAYSPRDGLNTLGAVRASTAIYAMIDDHEVIDDFAGGADPAGDSRFLPTTASFINDTERFETGLEAFVEFNPIESEAYEGTADPVVEKETKLYRSRTFGSDAAVMVLDTRSFRSAGLENPSSPFDDADVLRFREQSFDPSRTMLGAPHLEAVEDDLLAADAAGITWKFVMVPEPIQNLGAGNPRDRFEGYAYERTRLLRFIHDHDLRNVVFVTADIHGTVVNNLQYQEASPSDPQVDVVSSFEISAPAVAYDPTLGQELLDAIAMTPIDHAILDSMSMDPKDELFRSLLDDYLQSLGFDPTGLDGSTVDATLLEGRYVRVNAFGWLEFEIDRDTQALTVTTWGIDPYTPGGSASAAGRRPFILNRFVVRPSARTP